MAWTYKLFSSLNDSQGDSEGMTDSLQIFFPKTQYKVWINMISKPNPVTVGFLAQPSTPPSQGGRVDSRARLKTAFRADGLLVTTFCKRATFTRHQKRIVDSNPFPALCIALLPPVFEKYHNWKTKLLTPPGQVLSLFSSVEIFAFAILRLQD